MSVGAHRFAHTHTLDSSFYLVLDLQRLSYAVSPAHSVERLENGLSLLKREARMALWSTLLPLLLAALLGLARGDNAVGSACASPAGPANSSGSTGTRCELQYLGECLNRTLSGPVTLLGTTIQSTWEMPGAFIEVTPGTPDLWPSVHSREPQ